MTTEHDPRTRIVLSWLREDTHENAERMLARALDEVDTTPQRRSWWPAWRNPFVKQSPPSASVPGTIPRARAIPAVRSSISLMRAGAAAVVILILGAVGMSIGPASPSPTIAPPTTGPTQTEGAWWPQANYIEAQEAQGRADAGDAVYTWQVDPSLVGDGSPWGAEILDRFPREVLGWEAFIKGDVVGAGYAYVEGGGNYAELVLIRCAAGRTNPLYPNDPNVAGCAPTIDEFRYETVMLSIEQPMRRDPSGIWVVTEWTMLPPSDSTIVDHFATDFTQWQVQQVVPPSDAEAATILESFLEARIDGEGAETYVHNRPDLDDDGSNRFTGPNGSEVPILYATSGGADYERYEIERRGGPEWPHGTIRYRIGLFAQDGAVVRQSIAVVRQEDGAVGIMYDRFGDDIPTTENGRHVPIPYSFLNGDITFAAALPWNNNPEALFSGNPGYGETFDMALDPLPVLSGCETAPAPADAAALAQFLQSDPDFEVTAPVTETVGGIDALRMDVAAAQGATGCDEIISGPVVLIDPGRPWELIEGFRMRLYVLDLPDGSDQVLVIAVVAPVAEFDRIVESATPIVESIEFHFGEPQ